MDKPKPPPKRRLKKDEHPPHLTQDFWRRLEEAEEQMDSEKAQQQSSPREPPGTSGQGPTRLPRPTPPQTAPMTVKQLREEIAADRQSIHHLRPGFYEALIAEEPWALTYADLRDTAIERIEENERKLQALLKSTRDPATPE